MIIKRFFFLILNHCQTHLFSVYIKIFVKTGFILKLYNFFISLEKLFNFKSI